MPGGVATAIAGIVACLSLAAFNILPMVQKALSGDPLPLTILVGYCIVGVVIYATYGYRNSKLAKGIDILDTGPGLNEALAPGHGDALNR